MEIKNTYLFVTNSHSGGGAERATNLLVNALFKRGINVNLLCLNDGPMDLVQTACPTYFLNRKKSSNPIRLITFMFRFRRLVRKIGTGALILNCELPELLGMFAPKNRSRIVVEHSNSSWSGRKTLGLLVRLLSRLLFKVRFVAVSDHIKVYSRFGAQVDVIPNLTIPAEVVNLNIQEIRRLVYIGRLVHQLKCPELAFEIMRKTGIPGLFIGNGPIEWELKHLSNTYGLDIEFAGWKLNPWSYVRDGDLLIVPSSDEGDGLIVVEAIRCGLPLFLSDIPAFRRFSLAEGNYFADLQAATDKIQLNRNNLRAFLIDDTIRLKILEGRDESRISDLWIEILRYLDF